MWALDSQRGPGKIKVLDFPSRGACVYMPEEIEMMFGTRVESRDQDTLIETTESSGKLAYVMVSCLFTKIIIPASSS